MNYLGITSICLGAIAVLIAIQLMNTTDKLFDEIKSIREKCIKVNKLNNIDILMNQLDITNEKELTEIKNILINKVNSNKKIDSIIENYINYKDIKSRGIGINNNYSKELLNNNIEPLDGIVKNYEELFNITLKRIQEMGKTNKLNDITNIDNIKQSLHKTKQSLHKTKQSLHKTCTNMPKKLTFNKNNWCKFRHNNKTYCFKSPLKELCLNGTTVKSTKTCDFY